MISPFLAGSSGIVVKEIYIRIATTQYGLSYCSNKNRRWIRTTRYGCTTNFHMSK